jgi:hypothetical protein
MNFKFSCHILNFTSPSNISGPLPTPSGYVTKSTRPWSSTFLQNRSILSVHDICERRPTNFLCDSVAKKVRLAFQDDTLSSSTKFAISYFKNRLMHTFINTLSLRHASALKWPSLWSTTDRPTFQHQGQRNDLPDVILFSEQSVIHYDR